MTSEVFKLKGLSEQVKNDNIRRAEERLEVRMAHEAKEKARKEVEEKARLEVEEKARKEAKEKDVAEATATEAEAKAIVDAKEASHIDVEEVAKTNEAALTRESHRHLTLLCLCSRLWKNFRRNNNL